MAIAILQFTHHVIGMPILPLLLLLCVVNPTWGSSGYFVKPTQPANSSCPGQPCLTLAQYINASHKYFKSNNDSIFWLLSGTHLIFSSVVITDAYNVTIQKYVEHDFRSSIILFDSAHYNYKCSQAVGVCHRSSAIEFYSTSIAKVEGIEIVIKMIKPSFLMNGLSFINCDMLNVSNIAVKIISESHNNGIEIITGFSSHLDSRKIALNLQSQSENTGIAKSKINNCNSVCINISSVSNANFNNLSLTQGGIFGKNVRKTLFSNIHMTTSTTGITLVNTSHTLIQHSYLRVIVTEHGSINSAVTIESCCNISIFASHIMNVTERPAILVSGSSNITIQNMSFREFDSSLSDITVSRAIVMVYNSKNMYFHNCMFRKNRVSAIKAIGSNLIFAGTVTFANNTALLGAAMILHSSVTTFAQNSSLLFIGNHALSVGGAIHVDASTYYSTNSTVYSECSLNLEGKMLQFINNSAGSGGDVVYGGHMGLATTIDGLNCLLQFKKRSVVSQNNTMSIISSQPSRVCVCNSTGHPDCLKIFYSHTVYPGESIFLKAVVVGEDFGTGTGSIYGRFLSFDPEKKTQLEQRQYRQEVFQTHCNQLTYSILSAPTKNVVLVLTAMEIGKVELLSNATFQSALDKYSTFQNGSRKYFPQPMLDFPLYINISVEPCPLGFSLSESPYKCVCSSLLAQLPQVNCYIENQTFETKGTSWIGLNQNQDLVVSQHCPYWLCQDILQNITLADLDLQCKYNRSGVLCGACQGGLSVTIGSHRCLHCSNSYLSLLLPIALAGVLLVFAVKTLDMTVSNGYINGLALYFNIVQLVLIPEGYNNPLSFIVSWTNLDFGIETCFFDGLTVYWKTWLEFPFPLYLWTISGVIIMLARHSKRIANMLGSNPVSVLATLLLLSYTKLLRSCLTILSYSYVSYPNSTKIVWSSDGNIEYLGVEHLPLFAAAVAVLIFLCFPYTLTLLLGQWLNMCENQLVSRVMFRLKPVMDAYYGPLKDRHRYWIGVLLLLRVIIYILLALIPTPGSQIILLTIPILAICLLQMNIYVMGFYNNWYISVFEATIILNLAVYSVFKLYTKDMGAKTQMIIDNTFIAAGIAQLGSLILYRLFFLLKRRISRCVLLQRGEDSVQIMKLP